MGKVLYFLDHYKITNITCVFWYIKHTLTHRHTRSNGDMMWGAKAALKIQLMLADLLLTPSTGLDAPVIFSVQLALRHQDIYFIPLNLGFLSCFPNGVKHTCPIIQSDCEGEIKNENLFWKENEEWHRNKVSLRDGFSKHLLRDIFLQELGYLYRAQSWRLNRFSPWVQKLGSVSVIGEISTLF